MYLNALSWTSLIVIFVKYEACVIFQIISVSLQFIFLQNSLQCTVYNVQYSVLSWRVLSPKQGPVQYRVQYTDYSLSQRVLSPKKGLVYRVQYTLQCTVYCREVKKGSSVQSEPLSLALANVCPISSVQQQCVQHPKINMLWWVSLLKGGDFNSCCMNIEHRCGVCVCSCSLAC